MPRTCRAERWRRGRELASDLRDGRGGRIEQRFPGLQLVEPSTDRILDRAGLASWLPLPDGVSHEQAATLGVAAETAGTLPLRQCRRLLTRDGTYVSISSPKSRWMRPLARMRHPGLLRLHPREGTGFRVASRSTTDQAWLAEQVAAGRL